MNKNTNLNLNAKTKEAKSVLILGLAKSGQACINLCEKLNYQIFIYDDKKGVSDALLNREDFKEFNLINAVLNKKYLKLVSLVILSPSFIFKKSLLKFCDKQNIEVVSELEFASRFCKAPICAITGTNGKTTTATLLGEIFKATEKTTHVLGNIGTPLAKEVLNIKKQDDLVLEVSSYQLQYIKTFQPHIAGLLNIETDHLNYHKTFDNYLQTKLSIFKNMTVNDFAVINLDDEKLFEFSKELKCQVFYFSTKSETKGVYAKNGEVYFNDGVLSLCLFSVNELKLRGEHNLSNVLCASLMAILNGVSKELIREQVMNFKGLKHRMQFVCKKSGVEYYNDSKGTNVHSTATALKCFEKPLILILGGSDKGENYDPLFKDVDKIKKLFVYGKTANKIMKSAKKSGMKNIMKCKTLDVVMSYIKDESIKGDIVLFSPACASFDQYKDYKERGDHFISLI